MRLAEDLTSTATFDRFYWSNSFYNSDFKKQPSLEPTTAIVLLELGCFLLLSRHETRAAARPTCPRRCPSRRGRGSLWWRVVWHGGMLLLAVAYVDVLSGMLHVVLDNPAFTTWPLRGPGAVGFQRHHHHPAGITVYPLINFVQEHLGGMAAMLLFGLFPAKWSAGAATPAVRLFYAQAVALSCVMMASHRWSHTMPDHLPRAISVLQSSGLLLDHHAHSLHHVDYNMNFAIFTGWINPSLNFVTAYVLHERSQLWLLLLVGWAALPFAIGNRIARAERPNGTAHKAQALSI